MISLNSLNLELKIDRNPELIHLKFYNIDDKIPLDHIFDFRNEK